MRIKKEIRKKMESILRTYYGGGRNELVSRKAYEEVIEFNNELMEYLGERGEEFTPMYFPRRENPKSMCGSCFTRVMRNISWAYYKHELKFSKEFELQKNLTTGEPIQDDSRRDLPVRLSVRPQDEKGSTDKAESNESEE